MLNNVIYKLYIYIQNISIFARNKHMYVSRWHKDGESMNLNILKCMKASHVCSQNTWPVGMFKPKQYGKGKKVKTCPEYGTLL